MATSDKLQLLISTKNNFKNVLNEYEEGIITEETAFKEYPQKARELLSKNTSDDDWHPELDWWDIETILENDTEDYEQKMILLLRDGLDDNVNNIRGFEKYKLSDGQVIETEYNISIDLSNKFDIDKDKECSKNYKTRYVICYSNKQLKSNLIIPSSTLYCIIKGINTATVNAFANKALLQCVRDNSKELILSSSSFQGCSNLQKTEIHKVDTKSNVGSVYSNCISLKKVSNLNLTNNLEIAAFFQGCNSLKYIENITFSTKLINITSLFMNCYQLKEIMCDFSDGTINSFSQCFYGCYTLEKIGKLNFKNATVQTNNNNIFWGCNSLIDIEEITNISVSLNFSACNLLNHSTLLKILNGLVDLTGEEAKTLTLGATNLAKLTDEEKAIATDKNWILK